MAERTKKRPAPATAATQPDDRLLALDNELSRSVLELEILRLRHGDDADAEFEHEVQSRLGRISELYNAIAVSRPKTLAGAAVLLRHVPAMLGDTQEIEPGHLALASKLVDSALAVVEKNAV